MNEDPLLPVIEPTITAVGRRLHPALRRVPAQSTTPQPVADTSQIVSFITLAAADCHHPEGPAEVTNFARGIPSTGLTHVASFLASNDIREPEEQVEVIMDMQVAGAEFLGRGRNPMRLFAAVEDIQRALSSKALFPEDRRLRQ